MNARTEMVVEERAGALSPGEVRHSLQKLLASQAFARAPRMRHLLTFLVEKKLDGREHDISEYAIGMEVFRRDARCYDTTLDPVVRVQMGRLRGRLAGYYATAGCPSGLRLSIPSGTYVPVITLAGGAAPPPRQAQLQLAPLRNLTEAHESDAFVCGVDEELGSRLFATFGSLAQPRDGGAAVSAGGIAELAPLHRLEGSVRVEKDHVRASMRLVETAAGRIAWLSQFDCRGELGMTLQEELAGAICAGLQRHLATR